MELSLRYVESVVINVPNYFKVLISSGSKIKNDSV